MKDNNSCNFVLNLELKLVPLNREFDSYFRIKMNNKIMNELDSKVYFKLNSNLHSELESELWFELNF